ncbi:MAG TPA: AAA family ATPase, partial [Ilumatobacteraceae bacterium]|nr:AAA family ATPase [Ilumatobacteraceae bacterium]
MGRTDELDRLGGITDAVISGDRRVVLISGEPGVGKSRLVTEHVRLLRDSGCRAIVGRCVEFGDEIWPLAALRELLACLVDELDDETLDLVLGGSRAALGHLVPELGGARPASAM